jgi:DtxR family Mn-dependent transcriptional regulator
MVAAASHAEGVISSPLEDYLETIYLLVQKHGYARVKDIARARDVKAATVSVALRKLADGDFVNYERRAYIGLTPKGETAARRILTRHRLLTRFFEEVLKMSPDDASEQACAMEHSLTDEAMDRFVRFFEFLGSCPVIETFQRCPIGLHAGDDTRHHTAHGKCATCAVRSEKQSMSLSDLEPGQCAMVTHVTADGAVRQRILDMGILPESTVELERTGLKGDPLWIRCQDARLALRRSEACTILVRPIP